MDSSGLWISAWTLAFMCLLKPGSGNRVLREGETCGESHENVCESGLICLSKEPSSTQFSFDVEGVCTRVPACNCSEFQCPPPRRAETCFHGSVMDPCGCCSHCPKKKGQVCGGPSWRYGNCEVNLVCAAIVGLHSISPPQTGVCKEVPSDLKNNFPTHQCPVQYGCNVHVGNCDCYADDACDASFRYNTYEACDRDQWAFMEYDPEHPEKNPPRPAYECKQWRCEVQGCECVCKYRKCDNGKSLYEAACCNILKESGCPNANCPEISPLPCPADSFISEPHIEPRQCCPLLPPMCTCNFQTCTPKPKNCPLGHLPKRVTKGTGHPGNCCDRYECVKEGE